MLRKLKALPPVARGVIAMTLNSVIWGLSNSLLGGTTTHPLVTAGIVYSLMATTLVPITWVKRLSLKAAFRAMGGRKIITLSALEVGILVTFLLAVRFAPLGPVVAVQLTFPILLMLWERSKGLRRLTGRNGLTIFLIIAALGIVGVTGSGGGHSNVWLGLGFGLASACTLAIYTEFTSRTAPNVAGGPANAWITMVAAALLGLAIVVFSQIPALAIIQVRWADVAICLLIGPFCGFAALLSWEGVKLLKAVTAGNIRLLEPFIASGGAYWLRSTTSSPAQLVAVVLVVVAVYLGLPSTVGAPPSPRTQALP